MGFVTIRTSTLDAVEGKLAGGKKPTTHRLQLLLELQYLSAILSEVRLSERIEEIRL